MAGRFILSLRRDTHGISTVEFAIVAPVVFFMLLGFLELAYVSSARTSLESALLAGGRVVAATTCPAQRPALLQSTVNSAMVEFRSSNNALPQITSRKYGSSFAQVGQPEPFIDNNANSIYDAGDSFTDVNGNGTWDADMGTQGSLGGAGDIVTYEATFQVASLIPWISRTLNGGNSYPIRASAIVRNEPIFRSSGC
jgi:Flp pilus assembly protein TadG